MNNDTMKLTDLEMTWNFEANLLTKKEDGSVVYEKQVIKVPRVSTRQMFRYRKKLLELYGPILIAEGNDQKKTAIINNKLGPETMGEVLVDVLMPGLLDRIHPDSFDELIHTILEVENEVLNPQTETETKEESPAT